MSPEKVTPHELAADDVLSVLLNEERAYDTGVLENDLRAVHMPTEAHKKCLDAICQLRMERKPLHDTLLLELANGAYDVAWLAQRTRLYDETRTGSVFVQNVKLCIEHGTRAQMRKILHEADKQLGNGKTSDQISASLIDLLSTIKSSQTIKGETAAEMGDDFRVFMESEPSPRLSTGLEWLDGLTGGFDKGHIWWIAGAYKGRKSTFMLNLVLNALMSGGSVAVLSREMDRKRVNAQLVAMLATAHLLQHGIYNAMDKNNNPLNWISATALLQAQKRYKLWDARKVEAVDHGIKAFYALDRRLRIYDTGDGSGSLSDLESAYRVIKRDKALYAPDVVFVDYMQLFDAQGQKIYEQVSNLAKSFQRIAQREKITLVVVAQKNEDSIKNGDGYSPGIKGGGDPAQTADYLLVTSYRQGEDANENEVNVNMRLSRHGRGGASEKTALDIHPSSGLLLGNQWIGKKTNLHMVGGK